MKEKDNPGNEGHTREWQDRARVVLDTKKAARTEASPRQSPSEDDMEQSEENNDKRRENSDSDRFY